MRILVVEDEAELRESLQRQLADLGFGVDVAADGEEGLLAGLTYTLDAAIVDIGLPKRDGIEVIRLLRAHRCDYPIVVLTARNGWRDRVDGLAAGADDYVGKPFHVEEIFARVSGLVRRTHGWATPELVCGPFVLNTRKHTLTAQGAAVDLTSYEYRILEYLMLRAGEPISTVELADHLYEDSAERDSNVIAQLVFRIRRKMDPDELLRPIETLRGGGYRFVIPRVCARR